jgi:hypothetical protein
LQLQLNISSAASNKFSGAAASEVTFPTGPPTCKDIPERTLAHSAVPIMLGTDPAKEFAETKW